MPAISTMVYPAPGFVRVEVNWADINTAARAATYRVDCITGERTPLRPYVSFSGDFLDLSCGYGIFWDTEAQLDRCVYYCTQAQNAAGNLVLQPPTPLLLDTFTRVVANSWGLANTGQQYTSNGGAAATHLVNGTRGVHNVSTLNLSHRDTVDVGTPDQVAMVTGYVPVFPITGTAIACLQARYTDTNNQWRVDVSIASSGVVTGRLRQNIGGSITDVATANLPNLHVAGDGYTFWISTWGSRIQASVWRSIDSMPPTPMFSATDTVMPLGTSVGPLSFLSTTYTGVTPAAFAYDDFTVYTPCPTNAAIEACTPDLVVPSSGDFRLGDPVRPCNDVTLLFDASPDPDCVPTQGIFFGNMADEAFGANSTSFLPVNARFPIVMNRKRKGVASSLTVASRTFADRDAIRDLTEPEEPLLLRGPAQYGIPDRYMAVGDVTENRPVSDHRVQPRAIELPHFQTARPSGPSLGVCGTRVQDLCDMYPTWDAIAAAGLSWADLLRGKASGNTPIPDTVARNWGDVNSQYANWLAVLNGNTDWDDLLDGA